KEPKINYTVADIHQNHTGGVVPKLIDALTYLAPLGIKEVIQGDFLYSSNELTTVVVAGEKYVTFKPNTLVYAVPYDSALAKKFLQSNMGIVFHTRYTGRTIASLTANFSVNVSKYKNRKDVVVFDPYISDLSGTVTFTDAESNEFDNYMLAAAREYRKIQRQFVDYVNSNKDL
ncbi:DUF6267 family protein, partial [Arthrospira platensis SPKY1]|nr:DUF6267 family protein [Arthrospira platensis SPKY1]